LKAFSFGFRVVRADLLTMMLVRHAKVLKMPLNPNKPNRTKASCELS